jgi:hypothetical protein
MLSVKKALLVAVAVVVGLFAVVVASVAVSFPSGSVTTSESGDYTVQLAMLTVPIAQEQPIAEAPSQYLGIQHAAPEFDTTDLGSDLTFPQETSDLGVLDSDRVARAVYLGHDSKGDPYYIWQVGSSNILNMFGQIIADFGAVGRLGSSYGGLITGDAVWESAMEDSIAERGLTDGALTSGGDEPAIFTMEWHALPEEVAVVVYFQKGEPVGWQRPVSGTAAFHVELRSQDDPGSFLQNAEMVALTATGDEWNRYGFRTGFVR